ncbi:hypothetical protein ACFQ1E_09280 [Sphingomonas canadensis]|uniref:Uncharacterized protein n=1 Tax=Sphingomonas canadensis TaxID=1219257 RepID=A0ABW3H5U6_9SPHN|nr:hypothetical protein [Sphingomonas canadensis]MCW3836232.1 hypothetical protein [Sphingomonas canadensis]
MKLLFLAAAIVVAAPAAAQTAPVPAPAQGEEAPAADDPKGGYQPSAPLFSAPPVPGARIVFVPNPLTPDQAFPPPPPLPEYPVCKRGQYDNCRQRGG